MTIEHEQSKEIIRRYDEVVAQKASKTTIAEIYEHLKEFIDNNKFLTFKSENNGKFVKISEEMGKINEVLQTINESIGKDIHSAVRRAT